MQKVEELVSKDAVTEWMEHPVTAWFAQTTIDRADFAIQNRANTFHPGDPNKTQEQISYLNGAIEELNLIYGVLNEEWAEDEACPLNYLALEPEDE